MGVQACGGEEVGRGRRLERGGREGGEAGEEREKLTAEVAFFLTTFSHQTLPLHPRCLLVVAARHTNVPSRSLNNNPSGQRHNRFCVPVAVALGIQSRTIEFTFVTNSPRSVDTTFALWTRPHNLGGIPRCQNMIVSTYPGTFFGYL
jgi:hypothetical protein